ncbi:MAG: Spy/CpxP family protein refolding chaperone [Bacteroidia bacterium]
MNKFQNFFSNKIQVVVLILVLINTIVLTTIFVLKPGPNDRAKPGKFIIESLELNDEQISSFEQMKRDHRAQMNKLDEEYKEILTQYLNGLKEKQVDSLKNKALEEKMASIQIEKARITFSHFAQVKSICREDQQKKLNQIVPELINVMAPVNKGKRP